MKKILVSVIISVLLAPYPAWSEESIELYRLGLESSMFNEKIHYFTKALELNPGLAVAYAKRGRIYYFQEKYGKMLDDFRRFTTIKPSDPEGFRMLGLAQLKLENYPEAISKLSRAIELDPQLARAYLNRGQTYYRMGLATRAIEDSTKAIQLGQAQSTIGQAYTIRSKAYRHLGQQDLADEDFDKAYLLDPEYYGYRYFTITNHLASFASDSNYIGSQDIGRLGLIGIIVLLFVLIFKLALPTPRKDD